jgi:hypothetical protein
MSERNKTHFGRDMDGHRKVKQEDVSELETDPRGADYIRDDVRLGGAVADTSAEGALRAKEIGRMVEDNRDDVAKVTGKKR